MNLEGQLSIYDALEQPEPCPPFTVWTCVWSMAGCGWCGSGSFIGGGAVRNPGNANESLFYDYCGACVQKWGHPNVRTLALIIDRTQTERPGNIPHQRKE